MAIDLKLAPKVNLDRKMAEGKHHAEAHGCLKRHLARRVWHLPNQTPTPTPQPAQTIHCNTPTSTLTST